MTLATYQLPLGVRLRDTATIENLVPGDNTQAVAAAVALAAGGAVNLYLWGLAGTGKSHLLQAVGREAAGAGRRSAYLPLHELVLQPPAVLEGLHRVDLLCLDELDAVAGVSAWEQALVGLFDQTRQAGGIIMAAGRRTPNALGLGLRDLSTRLGWGGVYGLQELGDSDKCRVLRQRAWQRGLQMPAEVADYLLRRGARDLPSLLATLDRLDHASLAAQRRLTIPFVRQVLAAGNSLPD